MLCQEILNNNTETVGVGVGIAALWTDDGQNSDTRNYFLINYFYVASASPLSCVQLGGQAQQQFNLKSAILF